jgi:Glycosyl transferase family 2
VTEHGLSVVIPVRGRVAPLRRLMESLTGAVAGCAEPVEVIVIDDSAPADARCHRETCAAAGARYLTGPRHVGAKRNVGVRAARYDLVMFIDSDCLAAPDLLRRHIATLRCAAAGVAAVAGPTYVQDAGSALARIMSRSRLLNSAFEWPGQARQVGWATTCNLAVRRSAVAAVGGFAERPLTVVGGEDVDLGIRLTKAGYTIVCDPAAVVIHDRASIDSLGTVCRRLVNYGRSGQWLVGVHPDRARPKLNRVSTVAVAALLGLAASRACRRGGALLLPAVVAALLARDARDRLGDARPSVRAATEAVACAALDWSFDLGEVIAAGQLGRPDRLFTGFAWTDDAFVWERPPARPYGG